MKNRQDIASIVLGAIFGIASQYGGLFINGLLPVKSQAWDPASTFIYSSVGLVVSVLAIIFVLKIGRKPFAIGVVSGLLLWLPFLGLLLSISGNWL